MRTPTWQLEDVYNTNAQLPCDFSAEYQFVPASLTLDAQAITDIHCYVEFVSTLPWEMISGIREWWDDYGPDFVQKWVREEAQAREDD